MDSHLIAAGWKHGFGDAPPIGHLCRKMLEDRSVRIHSLPGSKRYPENDEDYRELLARHNAVATAVLGEGEECVLFVVSYDEAPGLAAAPDLPGVDSSTFVQVPELTCRLDEEPDVLWARVGAVVTSWRAVSFDSLLRAIAEDRTRALFANLRLRTAYAPYDGGADLFVRSPEAVGPARAAWRRWLSEHADGL